MRLTSLKPAGGQEHISWVLRKSTSLSLFLLLVLSSPVLLLVAQQRAPGRINEGVTAVLVDVVVRDRNGRPVTDLTTKDFDITEDGVPQKVDTFTRVSRGTGIGVDVAWRSGAAGTIVTPTSDQAAAQPAAAPDEAPSTTALVFDHLSSESLRLAQKATLDYVPMNGASSVRIGVFATGAGVRMVQRYTADLGQVRQAVARLAPSGTSAEERQRERIDELLARRREIDEQTRTATAATATLGGAAAGRATAEIGERENERRLVQTELNIMRSFDNLDRDHRGHDTSQALLRVVESLSYLPGRKTIVLFSEGLPVSPVLSARLDAVIDAANRAHVTTYAIDANGLRTRSSSTGLLKEIQGFVDERTSQLSSGNDTTHEPMTMAFERVEDTLKLDSRTGLARLAQDTGGFLVEQSNDLSGAFRRIDEDTRFHYLLTYSPSNTNFDGTFRAIGVKVRRAATRVFARKGYRAIRMPTPADAGSYEAAALAILDRAPLANAFPVHAAGFSFPEPARPGLTPVVLQVDTRPLRFDTDPRRSTYSAQVVVVVRIRDAQRREVEKLTQEYLLTGDMKDVEAARNGEILFYREPELAPGVYTLESIVFDAKAVQGSARIATLTVPEPSSLGMSSLVLVNRVEEVENAQTSVAPFYVGRTLLYPNVGQTIRKAPSTELPFYFTLYGNSEGVTASAQLSRNGQPLAEAPVPLAGVKGPRLQHVGRLPVGDLPSGTYELRIRVTDGRREMSRTTFFTLE
jgi:VWFA-related protein